MGENIKFDVDADGVALITIDTPGASLNVLGAEALRELDAAIDRVIGEEAIKGAVITTAKNDFLAGADLRMIQEMRDNASTPAELYQSVRNLNAMFRKLETANQDRKAMQKGQAHAKPFVAAVRGLCLGGGFEMALACHFRVCTEDAKFGLPEVMVGLLPGGGGTQRLTRTVGIQNALMPMLMGKNIRAKEALAQGVVSEIVEPEKLVETAKALVLANPKAVQPWDKKGFKVPGGAGGMSAGASQTMVGAGAMAHKESRGNYPAVKAILSCVWEGTQLPMDRAIEVEAKYFAKLASGPEAAGMIRTLFVNKTAAERGARRPQDVPPQEIKKIAMLGAGLMGAGIAYEAARAGLDVVLLDVSQESADKGKDYSKKLLDKAISRKRSTPEKAEALLARIHPTTDYQALKGVDLVIEAVFESPEIKREVTQKVEAVVGPDVIFGSNTSTLPISGLQQNWSKPENFVGIHFFSPVEKMPLVEMILGEQTGDRALAMALDFTRKIKKTPIVVNDGRGFYTSRAVMSYINEGMELIHEGVSPALIENMGKNIGYPMGPLLLNDSVNIDLGVKIMKATKAELGDAFEAGAAWPVMTRMSDELGRHGMKNAKGFYDYEEGAKKPKQLWPGLAEEFPVAAEQPEARLVGERLLYRQLVEIMRIWDEKVLTTPEDGDLGAIFGWGFPPFTGGPISYIDAIGAKAFVEKADALAAQFGPRFKVPEFVRRMAAEGGSFYGDAAKAAA